MQDPLIHYLQTQHPLTQDEQQLVLDHFEPRSFKEGEYLFRSGHVCRHRFFICQGVLRIMAPNSKGQEITHFFLKENLFCTILNSFEQETVAEVSIQAACDVTVRMISKTKLFELYRHVPWLKTLIDRTTQQSLLDKIDLRSRFLGMDSSKRYQLFLEEQPGIANRVSLADIASYLGITPQSLSRIRRNIRQ